MLMIKIRIEERRGGAVVDGSSEEESLFSSRLAGVVSEF